MHQDISELIIYEDPHLIVCRKPAGIPTQTSRIGTRDMVSLLKNHLADPASPQKTAGKNGQHRQPYLAVIHRLDQPVEGLLVFAKTPAAARELSRQITSSGFGKYYLAAVRGIPVPSEADLEDDLVRDGRTNTSRVCPPNTPGAKHARLHYRTLETQSDAATPYSVVEIHLDTGRHHQIRVQDSPSWVTENTERIHIPAATPAKRPSGHSASVPAGWIFTIPQLERKCTLSSQPPPGRSCCNICTASLLFIARNRAAVSFW